MLAGVYGTATEFPGVIGATESTAPVGAVTGIDFAKSGNGYGVEGESYNGPGVYGYSNDTRATSFGVEGETKGSSSPTAGVYGISNGSATDSYGVWGVAAKGGTGIIAESLDGTALYALGGKKGVDIFVADNSAGGYCKINDQTDLTCSGRIEGGGLLVRHRNSNGQHVVAFAAESATATIEDVGTGRMIGGTANVTIDPAFASVMDHKWYYVFLTPLGDTRGLYVSIKTPSAFQVRETERGRSSLEFDYRIVAHPLNATEDRLPLAPAARKPVVMLPR
jgi:hypothetical protein